MTRTLYMQHQCNSDVLLKVKQANSERGNPSPPIRSLTEHLPITGLDALPLSYRRLSGSYSVRPLN